MTHLWMDRDDHRLSPLKVHRVVRVLYWGNSGVGSSFELEQAAPVFLSESSIVFEKNLAGGNDVSRSRMKGELGAFWLAKAFVGV